MSSSLPRPPLKRVRPLLGTFVSVQVDGLPDAAAQAAIEGGFAVIAEIHRLMSFHEPASDVSRLNCQALDRPVRVHTHTYAVIRQALALSADSRGRFDITVAAQAVDGGLLPRPAARQSPDGHASWRDIELIAPDHIRFHRPLWLDLGGIAKGYAVDCAIDHLQSTSVLQCAVNAGGDLRVAGPVSERIGLQAGRPGDLALPVVDLENGSIASSSGRERDGGHCLAGVHWDGRRRRRVGTRSFVSVIAEQCMIADALTKVVLATGTRSQALLRRYGATAYLHNQRHGWRMIGTGA